MEINSAQGIYSRQRVQSFSAAGGLKNRLYPIHATSSSNTPALKLGVEQPAPSFRSAGTSLFAQIRSSASAAAKLAAQHKQSGYSVAQGVQQIRREEQGAVFLSLLAQVLGPQFFSSPAQDPMTPAYGAQIQSASALEVLAARLGSAAQAYVLDQSRIAIGNYAAQELGLALPVDASWGDIAESLWSSLSASSTPAPTVPAGTIDRPGGIPGNRVFSAADRILGGVGAAYSAYQLIDNFGRSDPRTGAIHGATVGGYLGSWFGPAGTVFGTAIGTIGGAIAGMFHSGKHKDHILRDHMRAALKEAGIIDSSNCFTLADGTLYDIGKDGKTKYLNLDGTKRRAYQIDFSNPLTPESIGWAQPIGALLTGGDPKLRTDLTGYIVNAAQSNAKTLADVQQNIAAIFLQTGISPEQALQGIDQMYRQGSLSSQEHAAYIHGLNVLFAGTTSTGKPTAERQSEAQ
ncbi:MAG TPA: hypothetical protein PLP17_04245 [Oligoflexia bacterium]|nr:hypothetical protein [Oligoflexia bacterium]